MKHHYSASDFGPNEVVVGNDVITDLILENKKLKEEIAQLKKEIN
jgi:hypothetical protein